MLYVCVRNVMDVVFYVCIVIHGAVDAHASSCRFMFVSCVHPLEVVNAAFYIPCRLLMLVKDARCDHMEEAYSRAGPMTAL